MRNWDLPAVVEIDGIDYKIRNGCEYRMVLDVISALNDKELTEEMKINTALFIFYENLDGCNNLKKAIEEMFKIISYNEENEENEEKNKPKLMDWEYDFPIIAPPVSRVIGYDIRSNQHTHWFTFISGYMEIGECFFNQVVSIRNKRIKGIKLDESDRYFYNENKKIIDLPQNLTEEEQEWLDSDW